MTVSDAPIEISLSLVSHTNAGKTTLARTLLGRDVGEVRALARVARGLAGGRDLRVVPRVASGHRFVQGEPEGVKVTIGELAR